MMTCLSGTMVTMNREDEETFKISAEAGASSTENLGDISEEKEIYIDRWSSTLSCS